MSFSARTKLWEPRRSQRVGDLWKPTAAAIRQLDEQSRLIAELQRQVKTLSRARGNVISPLHPFKLYQLPPHFRQRVDATGPNYSDDTDWLKWRVRAGAVTLLSLDGAAPTAQPDALINVAGTDGAINPDIETYLDNPFAQDIVIPAGQAAFFFWVTLTLDPGGAAATAQLYYGTSPADATPQADDWPSFPQPDATHQMIGYLDTLTFQADQQVQLRQLARADLVFFETNQIGICDGDGNSLGNSTYIGGLPK